VVHTPLVLGPDHVPLMKDGSQVAADPAMGVLSALFHGRCERQAKCSGPLRLCGWG